MFDFKISLNDLLKLTPSVWVMLMAVSSAIMTGCLFFSTSGLYASSDALINSPTFQAIAISFMLTLLNSIIMCDFKQRAEHSTLRKALLWGGVITTIVFGALVLLIVIGDVIPKECSFLCGLFLEGLVLLSLWYLTKGNNKANRCYKWRKVHLLLLLMNVISCFFVLQIVFGIFPLIECGMCPERIALINTFVVDLSLGIIVSTLFYYLLVYLPEKGRLKRVRMLSQGKLDQLAMVMQVVVAYFCDKYELNTEKDDLTDADFSRLPQFTTFSQEPIEYWFRQGAGPTTLVNDSTELGLLYNYLNIAREFSNGLYASNIFSMDDINLQELVIKIKNCSLMVSTENLYLNKQLPISLPHLRKGVLDFYQLYLQLSEYAAVKGITIKGDISEGSVPIVYT